MGAPRTMTEIRARRLADLERMSDAGETVVWSELAKVWGLSQGAAARKAARDIPGLAMSSRCITLPGGRTVACLSNGERMSALLRRERALAMLSEMADAGRVLDLHTLAQALGYKAPEGARQLLEATPGVVVTADAVTLPDGRSVARLASGQTTRIEAVREALLAILRDVAASGAPLNWDEAAAASRYGTGGALRKAVMRLPGLVREGDDLVVPGVGRVAVARAKSGPKRKTKTIRTGRRAAAPAVRKARSKPATPRAPRVSSQVTCAGAGSPASAALSERLGRVLAHLEGMVGTDMPRRDDMAKALGISVASVRYALEQLQQRGDMARVPGGWRLPSGRVLRRAKAAHVGRRVSTKRKALPEAPQVAGAEVKLTVVQAEPRLPAKVPALAEWPGAHECRWPIGELRSEAGLSFCRSKTDGRTYCAHHDARAHVRPALVAEAAE